MNRVTSIYLDLIRFSAAFIVFLFHAKDKKFTSGWLNSMVGYGGDAVMVFFVLSGFVIAYCVDSKENTLRDYLISRFARLYSVVLPALCLTIVFGLIGSTLDFSIYPRDWLRSYFLKFFTNLFFLNQIWFFNITPFANGPFWSLGYEFWYYMLFAFHTFLTGKFKLLLIFGTILLIGIKILLLFPVWIFGVISYNVCKKNTLSLKFGLCLFFGSVVVYMLYKYHQIPDRINWHMHDFMGCRLSDSLNQSNNFVTSYIVGLLVSINFIGFSVISKSVNNIFLRIEKPVRFCASYTFTLYLLHEPLLNFYAALINNSPADALDQLLLIVLVLLSVCLIGNRTEHKKHQYKKLFNFVYNSLWKKA
ncbi:acyltransferase family protein [Methylomonas methanica]|uniref:Acyltransferase 3 n=1 Tax=Methylomonas methanica (strain DSM 25384 / MC09) TaxID=857087 RepID=F9ZWG6_METMM|nr:acyltransferase [Methylomonas methanica]AEF99635.1 acyltransferase 3 [Methylomonas methanica MC09]